MRLLVGWISAEPITAAKPAREQMDPCRLTAPPRRNLEPRTRGRGLFRKPKCKKARRKSKYGCSATATFCRLSAHINKG